MVDDYGAYFQFGHGTHGNALAQVTGPYRMASVEYGVRCVLTTKCQQGVFRGAGSDAGNFCLERLVDAAAQELAIDPVEIRRRNFIAPASFPFRTPCGNVYDSGNYPAVLDRALEMTAYAELRRMQAEARTAGRYIGMDYLLPTALEVPAFEIGHVETPSPFTEYGVKGGGEGGRMIAPAAIAAAVEDALAPFGVRVDEVPLTPERIVNLVESAQRRGH